MGCQLVSHFAFRLSLIAALIALSGEALAIGLGELRGRPALGDKPRFEVDILGAAGGALDPACFRLKQPTGDDGLPWLKRATFKVRKGTPPVLEIVAETPLNDPALAVAVHVACGHDVVREYVILASPPSGRALMTMEPASPPRTVTEPSLSRERSSRPVRAAPPPAAALVTAGSAPASVKSPEPAKAPAVAEPSAADRAAAEKLKSMEATVNELQQRADQLTQKLDEAASSPAAGQFAAPSAPPPVAVDQPVRTPVAEKGGESTNWSLYGALVGALVAIAAWLGWRAYRQRQEFAEAEEQDYEVDPPRRGERAEHGGVDLQVDPVAMTMPMKLDVAAVPATPAAEAARPQSHHDSVMSISAATVDEHFEANPVMELAEIMLSFGRVKGAAQALQEYIDANPQEALKPWIRLMDVYRMAGMRHEFEKVARELNRNFNVEVQKWEQLDESASHGTVDVVLDAEAGRQREVVRIEGIEGMPAITEQVVMRWPSAEVVDYLNQLLRDNRGGTRLGFSLAVVSDILFLIELKEVSIKMESDAKAS